ncbi:hypothetical protein, partial [Sinorhizobium fredii]|uniref:hypothetical protein n=1 Tax=Rhizobium fredii TaxID=380 RepID=UPI001AEBDBDC
AVTIGRLRMAASQYQANPRDAAVACSVPKYFGLTFACMLDCQCKDVLAKVVPGRQRKLCFHVGSYKRRPRRRKRGTLRLERSG